MAVNLGGGTVVEHGEPVTIANEDKKQGTVELKILGQETHPQGQIFEYELCEGERIVAEEDVYLRVKPVKGCFGIIIRIIIMLLSICCSGPKKIFQQRARIAVTSLGRVFVYKTTTGGTETSGCLCMRGNRSFNCETVLTTFSLHDLSHVRLEYVESGSFCNLDCLCFSSTASTLLQLTFGKYPEHLNSLCSGLSDHVVMAPLISEQGTGGMFFDIKRVIKTGIHLFAWAKSERVIELWSPRSDVIDKNAAKDDTEEDEDQKKYNRMWNLQQTILRFMNYGEGPRNYIMPSQAADKQAAHNFRLIGEDDNRNIVDLSDGIVNVCRKRLGLLDNCGKNGNEKEEVLEAFPIYSPMSCFDFCLCILTAGLWYCCYGKKKKAMRGAVLITQKRLIEVAVCLPNLLSKEKTFPDNSSEDMEYKLAWWPLDMDQEQVGYLEVKKGEIWAHCKTRFGGLYMYSNFTKANDKKKMFANMLQFLTYMSRTYVHKVLEQPEQGTVVMGPDAIDKSWLIKNWAPADDEHMIHHVTSEDIDQQKCLNMLTCGFLPVVSVQEIIVTTHRIWASAVATNDPMCCAQDIKQGILFWMPLRNLQRFQVTGGVQQSETCLTRILNCSDMTSAARVEVGALEGFPIVLHRRRKTKNGGQMRDRDIIAIRTILGRAMAANHNYIASVKFYPLPTWPQVTSPIQAVKVNEVQAQCDVSGGMKAVEPQTHTIV
jgi:hypothetical protein